MSDLIADCLRKFDTQKSVRSPYERVWQDIRELVRPGSSDFFGSQTSPGQVRSEHIYDGTAMDALEELASGLHSYLTNPAERWFTLSVGPNPDDYDENILAWLEYVSDYIYGCFSRSEAGFTTAMHESYLDVGAFGTGTVYQEWSSRRGMVVYRTFPLADVFIDEDGEGVIDTVSRTVQMTNRQCVHLFDRCPPKMAEAREDRQFNVVHMVFPRQDRVPGGTRSTNKPFASLWICIDTKELIHEGGYDELPYHVGRWMKLAKEVYGRGPASKCLPDIKMLNSMEKTLIKAGQKAADPPLVVPDDGFALPIATAPGSLIFKENNAGEIQTLEHRGNLPFTLEHSNQKRQFIKECFYADWLRMEKENKEMTAYEVADRRNEKLSLISPMLGRIQTEQLGIIIRRTYNLCVRMGRIPPAPESLGNRKVKVEYISPAARAQMASKATEMSRFITEVIPLAQVQPNIMDVINFDMFLKKLAQNRGTTRSILRSEEELQTMRSDREKMQQAAQMAEIAKPMSEALKNTATASEKSPQLTGMVP